MDNLEARKQRVRDFFEAMTVNGHMIDINILDGGDGFIGVEILAYDMENPANLSIPVSQIALMPEPAQAAVIAEILGAQLPELVIGDHSLAATISADPYGNVTSSVFNTYLDQYLVGIKDGEASTIQLSTTSMDRLCAAWITWRTKHYEPAMTAEEDLDDHPF